MARVGRGGTFRSYEHWQVAQASRGDWMSTGGLGGTIGVGVNVDTRELQKLQRAMVEAGTGYKRAEAVLSQSLNRAGQRFDTQLKRAIKQWTGIRRFAAVTKRMHRIYASPGNMRAGVRVSGRHFRVTSADFGASWSRGSAGGRHSAWNRGQTAKGSFMIHGGGSSHGGGLLMTRTSSKRLPIKPLWGPNPVREMQRHSGEVTGMVTREAKWFLGECTRRADLELRKAKAKYGL